ncbi:MAG: hypothetical protein IKA39_01155 [Clostridia bacterium]|nr:hypothetical protein [Clostridia bacterium]
MRKLKEILYLAPILTVAVMILLQPTVYAQKAIEGITVWFTFVLPSLFPFFFFNGILTKSNLFISFSKVFNYPLKKTLNLSGISGYVAFLSYISGYPIGAKLTASLFEQNLLSKEDVLPTAILSSTSGIVFIIGTVGGMILKSAKIGVIIYICHLLSAYLTAIIFKNKAITTKNSYLAIKQSGNVLYETMYDSVIAILIVGGYISLFYVIFHAVINTGALSPLIAFFDRLFSPICLTLGQTVLSGIFEATQGIKGISELILDKKIAGIFSCALITFGGLSINAQNLAFISKHLSIAKYLIAKVIQCVIATTLCALILIFI